MDRKPLGRALVAAAALAAWQCPTPAAAAAAPPTCTITAIRMVDEATSAEPGVALSTAGGPDGCVSYVFNGMTAASLGFADVTTDDYPELAAALRHWNLIDGVPAVSGWVNLSPSVSAAMRAAGMDPTMFLQWLNEYDGVGTVGHPAMPPAWPPFLPRALVRDPARIAGARADPVVRAPNQIPPPDARAQPPVVPTLAPPPEGSVVASRAPKAARPGARTAPPPGTPPAEARSGGVTVPCVVVAACRAAVAAYDGWGLAPWYRRAWGRLLRYGWWAGAGLMAAVALTLGVRVLLRRRRNLGWYGHARGPR